ncbi:MAG: peptidase S41 [Bacteroidaceae bacterium]|nr:peptidase S41 [Bacteroidaceae bacterium]
MKKIIITILFAIVCHAANATVPDSIMRNLADFDYLTSFTEENYAAYPAIIEQGYRKKYETLKKRLRKQVAKGEVGIEKAACEYAIWFYKNFDTHYQLNNTTLWESYEQPVHIDYTKMMEYNPQPVSYKVDGQTWLVRVPSCVGENPTNEWVRQAVKDFQKSGCEYLIIDVRGNEGGSTGIWSPFIDLLVDHRRERTIDNYFRNTQHNQGFWEYSLSMEPDNLYFKDFLTQCKDSLGKSEFLLWTSVDAGEVTPQPLPKRAAIIVDNGTCSAGEGLIYYNVKGVSNRTKVYGKERTHGADLTGNVYYTKLPDADIYLTYPTCIEQKEFLAHHVFGKNGIEPDVHITLPYPKRLTDNIDEWVLWVAEDLKTNKTN